MSARVRIHHGDACEVLRQFDEGTFTACITDPPYGIRFMGKAWDGEDIRRRAETQVRKKLAVRPDTGNSNVLSPAGAAGSYDQSLSGHRAFQVWCEEWAREVLRVLRPGAMLLAFGGPRTFHRLACALEDAGFEIRDVLSWLYGTGFPKSLDVGRAIRRESGRPRPAWNGYGTALKPGWEPIILAMKPLDGTFAANGARHGVAGLNIDAARIPAPGGSPTALRRATSPAPSLKASEREAAGRPLVDRTSPERYAEERPGEAFGRWPANVVLDEVAAEVLDQQSGELQSGLMRAGTPRAPHGDGPCYGNFAGDATPRDTFGDAGGASRFFYVAKSSPAERHAGGDVDNTHPTVKPLELIRHLVRLVRMPVENRILDLFCGSGTTPLACLREGVDADGIEREDEYVEIARARLVADAPLFNAGRVEVL